MPTSSIGAELASLDWLLAHHGAKRMMRERVVSALELPLGSDVLDVACGPCLWTDLLRAKVGPTGRVHSLDLDLTLLNCCRRAAPGSKKSAVQSLVCGTFDSLPFPGSSFDAVFFSNGLAYARDPETAIAEQKRVVRPGGAVIGRHWNNSITIFQPVPPEILLEVQLGAARALAKPTSHRPFNNYLGQRLNGLFSRVGFDEIRTDTQAIQLIPPLGEDAFRYLSTKGRWFGEKAQPYISDDVFARWMALFDNTSASFILDRNDFYFCTIEVETVGRV